MNEEANERLVKHRRPDLSERPFSLTVERMTDLQPGILFQAWTKKLDIWFAAPGSVLMQGKVNTPFFFETHYEGQRHPHYGRYLRLETNRLVELTWVTGEDGTKGAETVVPVKLTPKEDGTLLKLTHTGFPDEASRDGHEQAWPVVLDQLEQKMEVLR